MCSKHCQTRLFFFVCKIFASARSTLKSSKNLAKNEEKPFLTCPIDFRSQKPNFRAGLTTIHSTVSSLLIHEIHLNEGYSAVITHLAFNLVNFKLPNGFMYILQKSIWELKIDKITCQMSKDCTMSFNQVNFVDQKGETVMLYCSQSCT